VNWPELQGGDVILFTGSDERVWLVLSVDPPSDALQTLHEVRVLELTSGFANVWHCEDEPMRNLWRNGTWIVLGKERAEG